MQKSYLVLQSRAHPSNRHVSILPQAYKQESAMLKLGEQYNPADTALESASNDQSSLSSPEQCYFQNL